MYSTKQMIGIAAGHVAVLKPFVVYVYQIFTNIQLEIIKPKASYPTTMFTKCACDVVISELLF